MRDGIGSFRGIFDMRCELAYEIWREISKPGCNGGFSGAVKGGAKPGHYFGYNAKITHMQAGIGLSQLAQFIAVDACVLYRVRE
jgi:hypothetical protein